MPELESNLEEQPAKTSTIEELEELATKLYTDESKKPGGGNPEVKRAIWLSGLVDAMDKEKIINKVISALNKIPPSQFSQENREMLVDRVVQQNNKPDPYSIDSRTLNSDAYKQMLNKPVNLRDRSKLNKRLIKTHAPTLKRAA